MKMEVLSSFIQMKIVIVLRVLSKGVQEDQGKLAVLFILFNLHAEG